MNPLQDIPSPSAKSAPAGAQDIVRDFMQARIGRKPIPVPAAIGRWGVAEGEALQQLHVQAMLAHYGGHVIGTKLGGGDMATLAALGMSGPFKGPIFSVFTHASPARLRRADFFACVVEAEISVRLSEDIGGHPYLPERDVLVHAIEAVLPSIEVADSRFTDFMNLPPAAILADAGFAGAWIHGTPVTDWNDIDLAALQVRLLSGDEEVRAGSGSRVMGDPLHALSLLVADLGRDGRKLRAGQVVSTGTCTLPYMAKAGETLIADFGPLGQVSLTLD